MGSVPEILTTLFLFLIADNHPGIFLARELTRAGNYDEAITEYKRLLCFSLDSNEIVELWYQIAELYKKQGKLDSAIITINRAISYTRNDSLSSALRIEAGILELVAGNFTTAELELLRVATFAKETANQKRAYFILGICQLFQKKWDEAKKSLLLSGVEERLLDSIFTPEDLPRRLSPSTAEWLSTFIPGAGQIYSGDWRNGINALLLNAGTAYLLINSLLARRIGDALIVYFPLFYRYYSGNRLKTKEIAITRNDKTHRRYRELALTKLLSSTDR